MTGRMLNFMEGGWEHSEERPEAVKVAKPGR